jgi:hypothetical protein
MINFFKKTWTWIKDRTKKILVFLGLLGVATASTLNFVGDKEIPYAIAEGQRIEFPYTDNNSQEDIIIYTDQEEYRPLWAWGGFYVYVAVENKSGESQDISFQSFFGKNFTIEQVDVLDQNSYVSRTEKIYEESCIEVASGTDCSKKETGEKDVSLQGKWDRIDQDKLSKTDYENIVKDKKIRTKEKSGDIMGGNFSNYSADDQIIFYRLFIKAKEIFDREEFDLEAVGSRGGYGLLDPTILTENFNSYSDGDLSGQGSWLGENTWDVEGTTVYEGAKAVSVTDSGISYSIYKNGTSQANGAISAWLRQDSNTDSGGAFHIHEGATLIVGSGFSSAGQIRYRDSVGWNNYGAYSADTWYNFQIEWHDAPTKQFRFRVDAGAWTDWKSPVNAWTTGVDRVYLVANDSTYTAFFDNISEGAVVAAGETQMEVIYIND